MNPLSDAEKPEDLSTMSIGRSEAIGTLAKVVITTYWRCQACGEVPADRAGEVAWTDEMDSLRPQRTGDGPANRKGVGAASNPQKRDNVAGQRCGCSFRGRLCAYSGELGPR